MDSILILQISTQYASQAIFPCSMSTIETLERVVKHHAIDVVLVFLLNIFTSFSSFFIADFEQVNVSWVSSTCWKFWLSLG